MQGIDDLDYAKKVDPKIWSKMFQMIFRDKKLLATIMIFMVLVAGIDIVYPMMTRYAIDNMAVPGNLEPLKAFIAVFIVFMLLQSFGVYKFIERGGKLEMDICYNVRKDTFHKLQELSFSYYDRTPVGYILARMVSDISRLSDMIAWSFVDIIWSIVYITGAFIAMFALNAKLAAIVLTVIPALVVISIYFQKRILKYQRKVRKTNSRITGAFNEGIMGAMTTKTLVREQSNFEEFQELTGEMKRASVKSSVISASFYSIVICLGAFGTAMAMYFGNGIVRIGGMSLGDLSVFITLSTSIFDPIQQIARIFAEFQSAQAAAERVLGLMGTPNDIVENPEVVEKFGDNFHPVTENWPPIEGEIEFKNVSFSYKEGETVLDDFSLKIKAGETIALVGETGAGKSTIANMICRFYEPVSGEILIDGVDYRKRSSLWLEKSLGYVLQTPHLFSGTIEDNIRYARKDAPRAEVEAAARLVSADAFIQNLPNGYETEVGEGGALLSTGQKQLVSFARVILADPRIFVLDEATSSVDTETEQLIQRAVTTVLTGRTSIIVAHRLSTIRSADRILVIRDGKITEQGSHKQLMQLKGYYHNLYTNQFRQDKGKELLGTESTDERTSE